MKRLFLSVMLAVAALCVRAEYTTMTFVTTDNSTTIVSATALAITFSGETLLAQSGADQIELPLAQMAAMYFSNEDDGNLSGIEAVMTDDSPADVYTTDGIHAGRFSSMAELRNQLPAGLYIIKNQSGQTCKLILAK